MPRGYPDYQNPVNQVAGRRVDFSGIQTAQLGLATLDGLGRLVWYDLFHDGLGGWYTLAWGATCVPRISNAICEIPPSCMCIPIGGLGFFDTGGILRSFMFTNPKTIGCEMSFLFHSSDVYLRLGVYLNYGGIQQSLELSYWGSTGWIRLLHAGGFTTIYSLGTTAISRLWVPMKIVIDFEKGTGRRAVIGCESISLVQYNTITAPTLDTDQIYIQIFADRPLAGSLDQYIGHFYLTMDEP
jgi:hypothetical protein